jgi:indole-3-glycerol phosphate synthase
VYDPGTEQEPKEVYPKVNRSARVLTGILARIVDTKRDELAALRPDRHALRAAAERAGAARPFAGALERRGEVSVIAEFKRRSPSAGEIGGGDPAEVARAYAAGGAAALSVLTDREYFGGSLSDLVAARSAATLPILRKDFVLDELQIWEARAAGADAVLLIVRILEDARLAGLLDLARELRMGALVEVHDEPELERALGAGAAVIGVNNRDLDTFRTDLEVTTRLAPLVPGGRILVGESGIRDAGDVDRLGDTGVDAVLVGETLMRGAGVAAIAGRPKRDRSPVPVRRACSC